jgi:hypothetical protein
MGGGLVSKSNMMGFSFNNSTCYGEANGGGAQVTLLTRLHTHFVHTWWNWIATQGFYHVIKLEKKKKKKKTMDPFSETEISQVV